MPTLCLSRRALHGAQSAQRPLRRSDKEAKIGEEDADGARSALHATPGPERRSDFARWRVGRGCIKRGRNDENARAVTTHDADSRHLSIGRESEKERKSGGSRSHLCRERVGLESRFSPLQEKWVCLFAPFSSRERRVPRVSRVSLVSKLVFLHCPRSLDQRFPLPFLSLSPCWVYLASRRGVALTLPEAWLVVRTRSLQIWTCAGLVAQ